MSILTDHSPTPVLEHADDGEVCTAVPFGVPVLNPVGGHEQFVLLGAHRDRFGSWLEIDVDGAFARVRLDDLAAALAGAREALGEVTA